MFDYPYFCIFTAPDPLGPVQNHTLMNFQRLTARIKTPEQLLWLGLALWWILNLLQAGLCELANDEAYYHMFAQDLAWGYFDHPPMTPVLVWLGSFLGGELGVRFFFTLLQPIYVYVLWRIIRPDNASVRDAGLFLLITAAMPILQLYGFIAVPDGPLMFFTALLLGCYKRFTERNDWLSALGMGVCMAALAYSKYHGALVVLLLIGSNLRLLKNPKFYAAGILTLLLILPHLFWQYQHDWVSFRYHLIGRNRDFEWGFVSEYILNLFAIFNPFLFPVFLVAWWKNKAATPVLRALSCIAAGFILFFLTSTLRGYVQPQWEIPATFGIIALLFGYTRERARLRRYTVRIGWITLALIVLVRLEMIFNPLGLRFEVFDNQASYDQIHQIAQDRPVIFDGGYTHAAKYEFYTDGKAYARPTIYYRTSQYELKDDDRAMAGHPVIVEVADSVSGAQTLQLANGRTFSYIADSSYRPVREILVRMSPLPATVHPGDTLHLEFDLINPYGFDYTFGAGETNIGFVFRRLGEPTQVFPLPNIEGVLPAHGQWHGKTDFVVPDIKPTEYQTGLTVRNSPASTWFNSEITAMKIE